MNVPLSALSPHSIIPYMLPQDIPDNVDSREASAIRAMQQPPTRSAPSFTVAPDYHHRKTLIPQARHPQRIAKAVVVDEAPNSRCPPSLINSLQFLRGLHLATAASVKAMIALTPPLTFATPYPPMRALCQMAKTLRAATGPITD